MAPTKLSIATLIATLTGRSVASLMNGPSAIQDTDIPGLVANITSALAPGDVFPTTVLSKYVSGDTADVIADAAGMLPADVFTGAPGVAKLVAWAVANMTAIAAGTGGTTALAAWATAHGYTHS